MRIWFYLGILVSGCTAPPPEPDPARVEPAWGYTDEDTTVRVIGTSFYPALAVSASGGEGRVDDGFVVRIVDVEGEGTALLGVRLEDLNTLVGVVPRGLVAGAYDIEVVAPSGLTGLAPRAFAIRDTRVARIQLDVDTVSREVFEEADVAIVLRDPEDEAVAEDLAVEVRIQRADAGPILGQVRVEGFDDFERIVGPSEVIVRGRLGQDGVGRVHPTLETPGELRIQADATDDALRVAGDDLRLDWVRGSALSVAVDLPSADFVAKAGEPFTARLRLVDQFGNLAPDAVASVAVTDACASFATGVRVVGEEDITVNVTAATNTTRCTQNRVLVAGAGVLGESEGFEVEPGDAVGLEVIAGPVSLRAGTTLSTFVSAVDAWNNLAPWSGVVASFEDGADGVEATSCTAPDQLAYCTVVPTHAGSGRRLLARSEEGLVGQSNAYTVKPATPARLDLTAPSTWTAGDPVPVDVVVVDGYGNPVAVESIAALGLVATDPRGEVSCSPVSETQVGCTLTTVVTGTSVTLAGTVLEGAIPVAVQGVVGPIDVVHGPLGAISVVPVATSTTAGVPLLVEVWGQDAWGNAFTSGGAVAVLTDKLGGAEPTEVALDGDGHGSVAVRLTRAGTTRVLAHVNGTELGRSVPVEVRPGAPARLAVEVLAPWVWVQEAAPFRVDAVDSLGNRVDLDDVLVDLESRDGRGPPTSVVLLNGTATGTYAWSAWDSADALKASVSTPPLLVGESVSFVVLRRCPSAPDAEVAFAGRSDALACFDPSGSARIAGDFSASRASPGRTLLRYGLAVGDLVATSTDPRVPITWDAPGIWRVQAFVQQDDGCGSDRMSTLYAGPDDGAAVGPVHVEVVDVPDLDGPLTPVDVVIEGVTTCHGVGAAGAEVLVRTDKGTLLGASPTGRGLAVQTDVHGSAVVRLDVSQVLEGGEASITVSSEPGTAHGTVAFEIAGDHQSPVVWTQTPEGALDGPVEKVSVLFSEAVEPSTLTEGAVRLVGQAPTPVTLSLSSDGRTLEVVPDVPIQPGLGAWALIVEPTVTDLAGNGLDGTWSGRPSRYDGPFGLSGTGLLVVRCDGDRGVVRPDGDPGVSLEEADALEFSFAALAAPAWWSVELRDADGVLLRAEQVPGTSTEATWPWDARDASERVVSAGVYLLGVTAKDARGNPSNTCARTFVVDLKEGLP